MWLNAFVYAIIKTKGHTEKEEVRWKALFEGKRCFTMKRSLAYLLVLCMVMGILPTTAFAGEAVPATVMISDSGDYTITKETAAPIVIENGAAPTITLNRVEIQASDTSAITVKAGASLTLIVEGSNVLTGADGFAGICVEPAYDSDGNYIEENSGKLTISGTGNLTVTGGNGDLVGDAFGGGAGIGGNGQNFDGQQSGVDFGTIVIAESFNGTLDAAGGQDSESSYGGGASIGTGGCNAGENYWWGTIFGSIAIYNGSINARSGGSGAGIGGGSGAGDGTIESKVAVRIAGGDIHATGGTLGAGIGGGGLCDGGLVTITGGIIKAEAGPADGPMGAAGIGGGNDASIAEVIITGGEVTAAAAGGAAGIGGGTNTSYGLHYGDMDGARSEGKIGKISISGADTVVYAYGGTGQGYYGSHGGAGIGAGYPTGNDNRSVAFDISITDGVEVNAYGGYHAQAIGYGYRPGSGDNFYTGYGILLELDDTVKLWAMNADGFLPALVKTTVYEETPITYSSSETYLVCYENAAAVDSTVKATGYLKLGRDASENGETELGWDYAEGKLSVEGTEIRSLDQLTGNWATIYSTPKVVVTYDLAGGTGADGADYSEQRVAPGSLITLAAAPEKSGHVFIGWSDGEETYGPGMSFTVSEDLTLTAQWAACYTLRYESNGGTSYPDEQYTSGMTVVLDKIPIREGYTFTGWYADEELTQKLERIEITGSKTVYAGWEITIVPDWLEGKDHYTYVIGYTDGTVKPETSISRAETATIFFRLLKAEIRDENLTTENSFADVKPGMWYNTAVSTMAELGILKGRDTGNFDPDVPITRAEFAAICARFSENKASGTSGFTDISGHWAEEEIVKAASLGWIQGYGDGTFAPDKYITRAEAMKLINRVLCRIPENEDDLLGDMRVWPDNQPGAWYYLDVQEATNSHDYTRKGEIYETWTGLTDDPDWSKYQN